MPVSRVLRDVLCAVGLALAPVGGALAATVQIDEIVMSGPTYPNDQWTLTVDSGAMTSTVVYTVVPADVSGPNLLNAATNWVSAINADSVMSSIVSAAVVTDISDPVQIIQLVGLSPAIMFSSSFSVYEASDSDTVENAPLSVSVSTVQPAVVPAPAALPLFVTAVAGMGLIGWRRRRRAMQVAQTG